MWLLRAPWQSTRRLGNLAAYQDRDGGERLDLVLSAFDGQGPEAASAGLQRAFGLSCGWALWSPASRWALA